MTDFIDQHKGVNIAIAVILIIMAFITPAAIIFPAKYAFITPRALEIGTTSWSLLTGAVGMLSLATVFLIFAIVESKMKKILLATLFGLIAFIGISLSIKDYFYITSEHFVSNEPFSYKTEIYEWSDFESVEEVLEKVDGRFVVAVVILQMKDGSRLTYKSGAIVSMASTIVPKVEDAGGMHIRGEA